MADSLARCAHARTAARRRATGQVLGAWWVWSCAAGVWGTPRRGHTASLRARAMIAAHRVLRCISWQRANAGLAILYGAGCCRLPRTTTPQCRCGGGWPCPSVPPHSSHHKTKRHAEAHTCRRDRSPQTSRGRAQHPTRQPFDAGMRTALRCASAHAVRVSRALCEDTHPCGRQLAIVGGVPAASKGCARRPQLVAALNGFKVGCDN